MTLLALAGAMTMARGPMRRRGAFFLGWALGFGYFAAALHWIVEPFLVDVARHGWMAPFAIVLMAAGGGVFWGFGAVLGQALGRGVLAPAGLGLGLLAAEITRSLIFTGFPWVLIGHVWIGTPLAQLSAYVGPHGLTALTLLLAVALAARRVLAALVAAVPVAAFWLWQGSIAPGDPADDAPLVRIVQPNAAQHLKWQPGMAELFFERQVTMSAEAGAPDLIVWPETSLPYDLTTADGALSYVAEAANAPVILGALRWDYPAYYNSLAVIGEGGARLDTYDKSHLVPFGEYIPWAETFARLGLSFGVIEPGAGYQSGAGLHLVEAPGIGPLLPLICYEGIFAEEVNAVEGRARAIVLITNDAWFGNWAGPAQHFAQARLRAIEQGLPVIRAANTGISGMIDARGLVVADLALNTEGFLDVPLPPALFPPLYTRLGDWPVFVLLVLAAVLVWVRSAPGVVRHSPLSE